MEEVKKIYFKTIIQGRLEFVTSKSYSKIFKLYQQRHETYYKGDVIFKGEDIFDEDRLTLEIPRYVGQHLEKSYKNTVAILEYCAQFAMAGSIRAWMAESGKTMHYDLMEPKSDKGAVQAFIKGRKLVRIEGKEEDAIAALSKAIHKYDRHAQAYERRAKVNFIMENYAEAQRDYKKCIGIDPTIPNAYYGLAKCLLMTEQHEEAIENLNFALKKSIALQPIYWKARRLKAESHIILKQWEEAEFDLKLFTNRNFGKDNPNTTYIKKGNFLYGRVLYELGKYAEADAAYVKSLEAEEYSSDEVPEAEIYRWKGLNKKEGKLSGYTIDLKKAIELGDKTAEKILKG